MAKTAETAPRPKTRRPRGAKTAATNVPTCASCGAKVNPQASRCEDCGMSIG